MVGSLDVFLGGRRVGAIAYLGGDRSVFIFDDAYAEDPARPTLSLSFKGALGELLRDQAPTQTSLGPFFSNLLPEGSLRDYLAERAGVKPMREYALLAALGEDLPGALTVRPSGDHTADEVDAATNAARTAARRGPLRFSLAGVQLKFSAVEKAGGGLTIPVSGAGGDWIIKLPSMVYQGVPENEFAMMSLARLAGVEVPEIRLVPVRDIEGIPDDLSRFREDAYAIRRFDRRADGVRVHAEDFAQVFGVYPGEKYKRATYRRIGAVVWAETGAAGAVEFIRRLVFNTLIGNADMHLKNWSLIYPDGRAAALAPAYDFVATTAYIPDDRMALKYARTARMDELTLDELSYLAARAGMPQGLVLDVARETVARFRAAWAGERTHLPITKAVGDEVERLLAVVPLASER